MIAVASIKTNPLKHHGLGNRSHKLLHDVWVDAASAFLYVIKYTTDLRFPITYISLTNKPGAALL